jgi:ubiquinone/menaquinone biosynthesis C-methylase UbiE
MMHRFLANSTVYELVQTLTGSRISEAKMRAALGALPPGTRILDAGGGTGILARIFDRGQLYMCMDIDLARVRFAKDRGAGALVGDAARMPVGSGAIDLVVLRAVSHHLTDQEFEMMIDESRRVLKPGGRLLFLDAIWAQSWLPGRLLWRIDQGSHPRTEAQMVKVLESNFELERRTTYAVHHRYFLALARPKSKTA